jgi:MFS family permease
LIGGITLGMAIVMLTLTRDPPAASRPEPGEAGPAGKAAPGLADNILAILRSSQLWLVVIIFFGFYGTAVTLQGLWATPFLMTVLNIERILASQLNMLIPIGVIVGAPFFGWLPDRFELNKSRVLMAITAIYTTCWVAIMVIFGHLGMVGFSIIFLVMGVVIGGMISTVWGVIREITPTERLGLTSGILNPAPFLGVAVFQVLTGNILDRAGQSDGLYPLAGFKSAFAVCLTAAVVCLVLSLFVESRPART